jgi:hypothetical protein
MKDIKVKFWVCFERWRKVFERFVTEFWILEADLWSNDLVTVFQSFTVKSISRFTLGHLFSSKGLITNLCTCEKGFDAQCIADIDWKLTKG